MLKMRVIISYQQLVVSDFRPPVDGIRLDTGVREGDMVTPNYDPMLAKLIVWAPSSLKHLSVCEEH